MPKTKPISNIKSKDFDKSEAKVQLLAKIDEGEKSASKKGWLSPENVEAALGL